MAKQGHYRPGSGETASYLHNILTVFKLFDAEETFSTFVHLAVQLWVDMVSLCGYGHFVNVNKCSCLKTKMWHMAPNPIGIREAHWKAFSTSSGNEK